LHAQRFAEAAALANELLTEIEAGDTFHWNTDLFEIRRDNNFVFYNEVLFGINNNELHTDWTTRFQGVRPGHTHVVHQLNLFSNLFAEFDTSLGLAHVIDIRADQWIPSNVVGQTGSYPGGVTWISTKFREPQYTLDVYEDRNRPFLHDFQPLIRMSELLLIQAEAALRMNNPVLAAQKINELLRHRNWQDPQLIPLTTDPGTLAVMVMGFLEREHYREFFGEGQAFFFLKRNAREHIFSGNIAGHVALASLTGDIRNIYVVPLPASETIIE
jgi:hypothetical protein